MDFCLSLSRDFFSAVVLLLPKCSSPTGFSEFRSIKIHPVLSKGLERLRCDQFVEHLDSDGLLPLY
jgi:hypothetical protein